MINLGMGSSWMPGWNDVFDEQSEYKKLSNLKLGLHLNPSLFYKISPVLGAGVHYSIVTSQFTDNYQQVINFRFPVYATRIRDERVYVNYFGAAFLLMQHFSSQSKLQLMESISIGPLFYRSESRSTLKIPNSDGYVNSNQNILCEGVSYGVTMNISLFYQIIPTIKVGFGVDTMYGRVKEVDFKSYETEFGATELKDLILNSPLKLSRIAGSFIVSYSF